MNRRGALRRPCVAVAVALFFGCLALSADDPAAPPESAVAAEEQKAPAPQLFSGQVVYLKDALARRDIETSAETAEHVVLETDAGEIIPILADWRGRAFYQDEQLRNRKVDLIGFRHPGVPYLNVIAVYTFNEAGERTYTDYWCDVCSIPMYEIQPCECCQGAIRLRFQIQDLPEYVK